MSKNLNRHQQVITAFPRPNQLVLDRILPYIIFFGAVFLRLFFFYPGWTFNFDESVVWNTARFPISDLAIGNYYHFRFHPPLFYILVHFLRQISHLEVFLRLPSLLASLVSFPLLFTLAKKIANRRVAILASFLYAISPFSIWWSVQLRVYPLLFCITLLYLINYVNLIKHPGNCLKYLIRLTLFGSLAFQLDYSFIWIFLSVNCHYLFIRKNYSSSLLPWLFSNLLIFANFFFFLFITGKTTLASQSTLSSWINPPQSSDLGKMLLSLFFSDKYRLVFSLNQIQQLLIFLLWSALCLYLLYRLLKYSLLAVLLLYLPLIGSFVISRFYTIFTSRNIFGASIGLLLISAIVTDRLYRFNRYLASTGIAVILFLSISILSQFSDDQPDWKTAANYLRQNISRSGTLTSLPYWYIDPIRYYNLRFPFLDCDRQIIRFYSNQDTLSHLWTINAENQNNCLIYYQYFKHFFEDLPASQVQQLLLTYPKSITINNHSNTPVLTIYCR